ncbi:MAG: VOC family protein [Candidatus Fibromonas sp.]|jgi:lactoylglutathione lyase/glyoxylase I family protein|nr:VOC family protein [Candidatus Fibromonas sp.]
MSKEIKMLSLAHICLNVRNLEYSIEYYQKLGFKPKFKFTRNGRHYGHYLEIGHNHYIELFEDPDMDAPVNTGLVHFCLESENIDALVVDLDSKGIPHTDKKLGCDNTYQIWLTDPDGNAFEIHQYTEESLQKLGGEVEADW